MNDKRNIDYTNTLVSKEALKKAKILSIQKGIRLVEYITEAVETKNKACEKKLK